METPLPLTGANCRNRSWLIAAAAAACLVAAGPARAQLLDEPVGDESTPYGEPVVGQFQVGAEITASRGAVRNIRAMVAVPLTCDEQTVRIVDEDISGAVESVTYRDLQGGARQMLITIPYLADRTNARAVITFEVGTRTVLPPDEARASTLKIPRRLPRELRRFVAVSPFIEAKDRRIRSLAREIWAEAPEGASDWEKIELLYDYVLENIEYIEGPDTSALTTLREGSADCHGRSALFIALCRAVGVPSRVVWVNNHVYSEFYLEDEDGKGAWRPAESAGARAFGEMPLARVIMQKGDNFRVPERPKDRLRYATDFLVGLPVKGAGKPKVRYIREQL